MNTVRLRKLVNEREDVCTKIQHYENMTFMHVHNVHM
jgi:hypothetical protein